MKKNDVETHNTSGYHGPEYPAVNVKVYCHHFAGKVEDKFDCTEDVAERALRWQFDAAAQRFWEDVQSWADECFDNGTTVYSAGRGNGWAVVTGLPSLDSWDAIQLGKWARFAKMCHREVDFLTSEEYILEDIEANRWAEKNAEEYNFFDAADGRTTCLADVSRCAHCN